MNAFLRVLSVSFLAASFPPCMLETRQLLDYSILIQHIYGLNK